MSDTPGVLLQKITQDQFSHIKIGALLESLAKEVPTAWKLLNINVDRYTQVPNVASEVSDIVNLGAIYQRINEILPTFPFVASSQLKSQPNYISTGQQLLIAGLGSSIAQYALQKSHLNFFLKSIDLTVEISKSAEKGAKGGDLSKLIHGDLILIAKGLQLKPNQQRHEVVEAHYCTQGLIQFFLRYYFDLIVLAESDEIAQHIDDVFLNFFINLRFQEIQYWKNFEKPQKIKAQMKYTIAKNPSAFGHPVLKNAVFDQINALHPIIHDGGSREMPLSLKKLLDEQLASFFAFSLKKMALFLRIVTHSKIADYPRYLLAQTLKTEPHKLTQLQEFLKDAGDKKAMPPELSQILTPLIEKNAPPPAKPKIFMDETAKRRIKAEQNINDRAHIAAYTSDQLEGYFKNYLDKLYDRVKKEGALTQDGIKEYLERLSKRAVQIAQKPSITVKEKKVFEEAIEDTLKGMGEQLSESETQDYQDGVKEVLGNLENMDAGERIKQIEVAGEILVEATGMSERKEEAKNQEEIYQKALALEIKIDQDPTHVLTIEKFLSQPILLEEKLKYLISYIPRPLSIKMHTIIEEKQQYCAQDSSNPIAIYKGERLLDKALTRLLFPQNAFKELLQQPIIPILPDKNAPNITVRDFFTFPFAEKKGPADDAWFEQHLFYLQMAHDQGQLGKEELNSLVENIGHFPTLEYKRYFNIIHKKKFQDTMFMAVYCLWQNNGLDKIRAN